MNAGSDIPYADQLETIQKAVDHIKENTGGLLPIKTSEYGNRYLY